MPPRPAGGVPPKRRLAPGERDFPHGHPDTSRTVDVYLRGIGECVSVVTGRLGGLTIGWSGGFTWGTSWLGGGRHRAHSEDSQGDERPGEESRGPHSLRRYQPDQVPRVASQSGELGARCWELTASSS